jgi:uncharacterized damage-inducible protein DinB
MMLQQYQLVTEARRVIFDYCKTMSTEDFIREVENFGKGSIRSTQVHIVDTYIHWIGNFSLKKSLHYLNAKSITSVDQIQNEFSIVNEIMTEFMEKFTRMDINITNTIHNRGEVSSTSLALFSHVITHEFHHKGQLASMGRILGYPPPDTDLVRF